MYVTSPASIIRIPETATVQPIIRGTNTGAQIIPMPSGRPLFRDGDDADHVYEIVEGVVRSSKLLLDGRRQVLSFGYPGDLVGISHDRIYHSDCDTVCPAKVRVYRKNAFNTSFDSDPEFYDRLLKYAAAEVNSMHEHFIMLGCKSATEKVASFLAAIMDRAGKRKEGGIYVNLPMCRSDIADFLGLSHETISRTLTRLREDGVIRLPKKYCVCVRKPSVLRAMAEES